MIPHERSLVQRYHNRPFALLGVNLNGERDRLRHFQEREHLTWQSVWDGADNAIASRWQVSVLPTLYLLDHRGVIRFHQAGPPDPAALGREIDKLVQEAEK